MSTTDLPHDPERVPMVPTDEWEPDLLALVRRATFLGDEEEPLNFFKAMAYHPKLVEKWTVFAARLLGKGILAPRDRELMVLRTVWNCGATYEWVHHVEIAGENGLDPTEIEAIKTGPDSGAWDDRSRALLCAADELYHGDRVGDETYAALQRHFDEAHLLEIVMLAGQYRLVAYYVRTFGVQLEDDMTRSGS